MEYLPYKEKIKESSVCLAIWGKLREDIMTFYNYFERGYIKARKIL